MPLHEGDAAALLQRCCLGPKAGPCGETCSQNGPRPLLDVIRDPGSFSAAGVFAPRVLRDLTTIAGCPTRGGNAVRVLVDGTDSFNVMLDLVRTAKHDVRFENFIFRADAVGRTFATELRARAQAGVRVRVLHDPVGAVLTRRRPADVLFRGSAAEVRLFNLGWPTRDARRLGRDHRKLVVADGSRLVAGGMCLADPWAGNCIRHCTWRDSAVYVEGPGVGAAAGAFDRVWGHARRLFGGRRPAEIPGISSVPDAGAVPIRIITDLGGARRTRALLERVIDAARRRVLITSAYFIPPDALVSALVRAVSRGVEVAVLIPGKNNRPVAGLAAEERLGVLLRHGVQVYRWQGAMIHAKSVVVDDEWTLVGSSNLDSLSLGWNAELNVEIHGSAVAETMARLFREDCRESMPFTIGDWRYRPRRLRLAGRLAATLARWL